MVNLGFGDLLPNGAVSDFVISNIGDIRVVLSTLVEIIKDYTTRFKNAKIVFTGSTGERTKLYTRILKTYHESFSREFIIKAFLKTTHYEEVDFDPSDTREYYAFYIKRIN